MHCLWLRSALKPSKFKFESIVPTILRRHPIQIKCNFSFLYSTLSVGYEHLLTSDWNSVIEWSDTILTQRAANLERNEITKQPPISLQIIRVTSGCYRVGNHLPRRRLEVSLPYFFLRMYYCDFRAAKNDNLWCMR